MSFAEACGAADASRVAAGEAVMRRMRDEGIDLVRIGWCDTHGILRGKTLAAAAVPRALASGIGMVSTILLKDTSDRTAYRVFEPGATDALPGFGFANNLVLLPDPASFRVLPWAPGSGWMRAEAWFEDATPVPIDTRRILRGGARSPRREGLGPHLRPRSRVPHLSPGRSAARSGLARSRARCLAGRAAGDDDDPSRLQPARRRLGRPRRRALAHRPAHGRGPGPAARARSRSSSGRARSKRSSTPPMRSPPRIRWWRSATA